MKITTRLYRLLYRSFSAWARDERVFDVAYAGGTVRWVVRDGVFWSRVSGGAGSDLILNLSDYTVGSLRAYLDAMPGYSVPAYNTALDAISARAIMDGSGEFGGSVLATLTAYTGLTWAILDTIGQWLKLAETDVANLHHEMDLTTAGGIWLDVLAGDTYGIKRLPGEADRDYAARTLTEVLTIRSNNIAIGEAIRKTLQISDPVSVVDVTPVGVQTFANRRSHGIKFDGKYKHGPREYRRYCEFDVAMQYDLIRSPDSSDLFAKMSDVAARFRAAGTRLRSFAASGGLIDVAKAATEKFSEVSVAPAYSDDTRGPMHDGVYTRDGSISYGATRDVADISAGIALGDNAPFSADDDAGMALTITRSGIDTAESL